MSSDSLNSELFCFSQVTSAPFMLTGIEQLGFTAIVMKIELWRPKSELITIEKNCLMHTSVDSLYSTSCVTNCISRRGTLK